LEDAIKEGVDNPDKNDLNYVLGVFIDRKNSLDIRNYVENSIAIGDQLEVLQEKYDGSSLEEIIEKETKIILLEIEKVKAKYLEEGSDD